MKHEFLWNRVCALVVKICVGEDIAGYGEHNLRGTRSTKEKFGNMMLQIRRSLCIVENQK